MIGYKLEAFHTPCYTVAQGEALDVIGNALKRRLIDFAAATKLRDLVRAGRLDEAGATLTELARAPVRHATALLTVGGEVVSGASHQRVTK